MSKRKFCPKCGKPTEKFYNNLCADCFSKTIKFEEKIPEKIILRICKSCGKVYIGEKGFENEENAIENFLSEIMKEKEIQSVNYRISDNKLLITILSKTEDVEKTEEKEVELISKQITCKFCNLKESKFFNVTIQLRAPKNLEKKILEEMEKKISEINKYDNFAFITSIEKLPEGYNIYIGSKRAAELVLKYLKNQYNISSKVTHKIYGMKDGKKIYRDTILIRVNV